MTVVVVRKLPLLAATVRKSVSGHPFQGICTQRLAACPRCRTRQSARWARAVVCVRPVTFCGITCHQLRHSFGRHMTDAGMPVTSIQRLLGHVRLRTTQLYLHVSDPKVQSDYEKGRASERGDK